MSTQDIGFWMFGAGMFVLGSAITYLILGSLRSGHAEGED